METIKQTTNMELTVLALQAANIATWAIDKASGGALERAGADVLDFLKNKFQNKLQIGSMSPELIQAAILSKAKQDEHFKNKLEGLVKQFNQIRSASVSNQETDSGVNVSFNNSSGVSINQQIGNQKIDTAFFRR
ncbi:hypothetical protein C8255_09960 [filamentous cyanobacterium CCP3]|nr:hypothetical protein C8255_09960 [filamentous cyanobacterium CCP3]